jgi:two-component system response regulator TctD
VRLLIVEDDLALITALAAALARRGFTSDAASCLEDAVHMIGVAQYAAILLDLGLPDGDGIDLIQRLRSAGNPLPVISITARSGLDDRVLGLNAGADDYITKPFEVDELIARLNAVLRRQGALSGTRLTVGNLAFDTLSGDTFADDRAIALSARERQLLGLLMRRARQVVSKQLAEDQLYGLSDPVGSNAVEVHAHRLRKKLEAAGADVRIETIRGVGYLLRSPAETERQGGRQSD